MRQRFEDRARLTDVMRLPILAIVALAAACGTAPKPAAVSRTTDIRLRADSERISGTVSPSATFADILAGHAVSPEHERAFTDAVEPVFSSRQLKAHHTYELERALDGRLREFTYRIDDDRFLKVTDAAAVVDPAASTASSPGTFRVELGSYRKEQALVAIRGGIDREHSSLVAAIDAAGEDVGLAIALADIFAGDIDFSHDLQPGDAFELVFAQVLREGARAGYGDILAATFTTGGTTYRAFRYELPGGKAGYYDAEGRSLKRFFLASPLKFEPRVTSGFSYRRLHPVLGIRRPHMGVDFGAPRGAPVVAIAEGSVGGAAFTRGGGNTVVLRHPGGYESRYLHLSRYGSGMRTGARVQQGQVIGYVGATGLATGPHLHYELKRNGTPVNPITEQRKHPPGEPIPAALRAAFVDARDLLRTRFVSALAPDAVTVAALLPATTSPTVPAP
jgi:murein DD-endopeptidase MepM/ murein hydrolase activator NlpD